MNEQFFLEFHMARSNIEMQRSGIEMGLFRAMRKVKILFSEKIQYLLKKE
jgi:hypothetical protein